MRRHARLKLAISELCDEGSAGPPGSLLGLRTLAHGNPRVQRRQERFVVELVLDLYIQCPWVVLRVRVAGADPEAEVVMSGERSTGTDVARAPPSDHVPTHPTIQPSNQRASELASQRASEPASADRRPLNSQRSAYPGNNDTELLSVVDGRTCSAVMLWQHLCAKCIEFVCTSLFLWSILLARAGVSATQSGPGCAQLSSAAMAVARMILGWLDAVDSSSVSAIEAGSGGWVGGSMGGWVVREIGEAM